MWWAATAVSKHEPFYWAKSKVRFLGGGESWGAGFTIEIVTIHNMTLFLFFGFDIFLYSISCVTENPDFPRRTLNKV